MSAATLIAAPLEADDRFRLRLEEDIRDSIDGYPNTSDPRDMLLHAIVELGRDGNAYRRGVTCLVVGACLETLGAEITKAGEKLVERAAAGYGV